MALLFKDDKKKNPRKTADLRVDPDPDASLFPHLKYLQLDEVRFCAVYGESRDGDLIDDIEEALGSRKLRRRKFPHLDIRRAINFGQDELDRLQKVVQTFTWDGKVDIDTIEDEDEYSDAYLYC